MHGLQAARGTRSLRVYGALLGAAATVVTLDQLTKQLALNALADGPVDVVEGVFSFRLTYNSGGAFGLFEGFPEFFLVATIVVIGSILIWARRLPDVRTAVLLGLVLGGGVGNLFDRIFRDTEGRVVDFIDLHVWPVFNVADSAIVVGVGLLILLGVLAERRAPKQPP